MEGNILDILKYSNILLVLTQQTIDKDVDKLLNSFKTLVTTFIRKNYICFIKVNCLLLKDNLCTFRAISSIF